MIMKRFILSCLFVLICYLSAFATPQVPNRLIYNGDTLLVSLPLPDYFYTLDTVIIDSNIFVNPELNVKLFGDIETCNNSGCGRGYISTWEIIDNQLYLTGIYSCCYSTDSIKADLSLLFNEKYIDGRVKAEWISGNYITPKGKRLFYDYDMYYTGGYEYDFEFKFKKGVLKGTHLYDNRKSKQSEYHKDNNKLKKLIYSKINWDNIPKLDTIVKIYIEVSSDEKGKVDEVKIIRGYNGVFDREAIRVAKELTGFDIYYYKGKLLRRTWMINIIFSEENRNKYGN